MVLYYWQERVIKNALAAFHFVVSCPLFAVLALFLDFRLRPFLFPSYAVIILGSGICFAVYALLCFLLFGRRGMVELISRPFVIKTQIIGEFAFWIPFLSSRFVSSPAVRLAARPFMAVVSCLALSLVFLFSMLKGYETGEERVRIIFKRICLALIGAIGLAGMLLCGFRSRERFNLMQAGNAKVMDLTAKAENGDREAMIELAMIYLDETGAETGGKTYAAKARYWLEESAAAGSDRAMLGLGTMNELGFGFEKNPQAAAEWYGRAAEYGNSAAMVRLGEMNEKGIGTDVDLAAALKWYERAAEKGDSNAMLRIGDMHFGGKGMPSDLDKALEWYEKAAKSGNADARFKTGNLLEFGKGDVAGAYGWYVKAADEGSAQAMLRLGRMSETGEGAARNFAKAEEWYLKAVSLGNAEAMTRMGVLRGEEHPGIAFSRIEAAEWFSRAARLGDPEGMYRFGCALRDGLGAERDEKGALELFEKAAEAGKVEAMLAAGECHERNGDFLVAARFYERAADKSDSVISSEAAYRLGVLLLKGHEGVERDIGKARAHFERAASAGNADAMLELGKIYLDGNGVTKDIRTAMEWFRKSASLGNSQGCYLLGCLYEDSAEGLVWQNNATALRWFEAAVAADGANAEAIFRLSRMLFHGRGGAAKDVGRAIRGYETAASLGNADAICEIAKCLLFGTGVDRNPEKALSWLEMLADPERRLDPETLRVIGELYFEGREVPVDLQKALKWLELAAAGGDADAMFRLGYMRDYGIGVKEDPDKAYYWFNKAADGGKGNADAMYYLGYHYERGLGSLGRDEANALKWYRWAESAGCEKAKAPREKLEKKLKSRN